MTVSRLFFRITAVIGYTAGNDLSVSVVIRDDELLNLPSRARDVRIMERIQDEQGVVLSWPRAEGEEGPASIEEALCGYTPEHFWPYLTITQIEPLLWAELSPEQQEEDENYRLFLRYQAQAQNTLFD